MRKVLAGVYLFVSGNTVLYVGQTSDLYTRLEHYHWGFGCGEIYFIQEDDEEERAYLEKTLIEVLEPFLINEIQTFRHRDRN